MSDDPARSAGNAGWIGKIALFLAAFVISLGVAKAFEVLTSKETIEAVAGWQQGWLAAAQGMAPLSLATNYFGDVIQAATDPNVDLYPVEPVRQTPASNATSALSEHCGTGVEARPEAPVETSRPTASEKLEITDEQYKDMLDAARKRALDPLPPEHDPPGIGQVLVAPATGVLMAWNRLTRDGGSSYLWAALQLLAGLVGFLWLYETFAQKTPDDVWSWAVAVPLGTIAVASIGAFALKYLMIGGLIGLGWFTCFAGLCAGATSLAGFCWFCVHKLAEFSVQQAVSPK